MRKFILCGIVIGVGAVLGAGLLRGQGPGQAGGQGPAAAPGSQARQVFTILYTSNNIGYIEPCG
jgi:hypothetical protein